MEFILIARMDEDRIIDRLVTIRELDITNRRLVSININYLQKLMTNAQNPQLEKELTFFGRIFFYNLQPTTRFTFNKT